MFEMVDFARNREFVMSTQYATSGGFSKWPDCYADPMHTYLGQFAPVLCFINRLISQLKNEYRKGTKNLFLISCNFFMNTLFGSLVQR